MAAAPLLLTGKQRSFLRALAHSLKPVVQVGQAGLTPSVLSAIDQALATHELIKVKVAGEDVDANALVPEIERATRSVVAQVIGKTLVIYRRHDNAPKIVLPRAKRSVSESAVDDSESRETGDLDADEDLEAHEDPEADFEEDE